MQEAPTANTTHPTSYDPSTFIPLSLIIYQQHPFSISFSIIEGYSLEGAVLHSVSMHDSGQFLATSFTNGWNILKKSWLEVVLALTTLKSMRLYLCWNALKSFKALLIS